MPVLIGQATTPWVMSSIVAYELTGDPKYLKCVINTADYMLGGNPLNMTWVTGLGHRSPRQLLHLDAWYDGIPEMIPGFVPYGPHRGEHNGWTGPWDPDYARDRAVYPAVEQWPVHELYFENRYCPITNEFTVHQNIAPAAAVYGYLAGKPASWAPNRAPVVELQTPVGGTEVNVGQPIRFAVQASDSDGWIALVEYYVGRDKVGESVTAPFIHDYIPLDLRECPRPSRGGGQQRPARNLGGSRRNGAIASWWSSASSDGSRNWADRMLTSGDARSPPAPGEVCSPGLSRSNRKLSSGAGAARLHTGARSRPL